MRVFLDVGANVGQTAWAVLDPKYRFERIVCIEPVPACCRELRAIPDGRIEVVEHGLWKESCQRLLFAPGSAGGSIYAGLEGADNARTEMCSFLKASDWFRLNLGPGDVVFMKLNCEGSECDIIDDLLDSGEYGRVTALMVDFDVRKIPSQRHREEATRQRLQEAGVTNCSFCEDVMIGPTHAARIQHWLHCVGADRCDLRTAVRQACYCFRAPRDVRLAIWWSWRRRLVGRLLRGRLGESVRSAWRAGPGRLFPWL